MKNTEGKIKVERLSMITGAIPEIGMGHVCWTT